MSSDLSRTTDLTTWFFQRNRALIGKPLPAVGGIVCLGLSSYDKLQLVNAPDFLHNVLLQCVGPLLQNHEVHGSDFEVKMVGYPWSNANFEEVFLDASNPCLLNFSFLGRYSAPITAEHY